MYIIYITYYTYICVCIYICIYIKRVLCMESGKSKMYRADVSRKDQQATAHPGRANVPVRRPLGKRILRRSSALLSHSSLQLIG